MALVLDCADGAVARRQGVHSPQTDRAMDMFTEFILYAAYMKSCPGSVSTALMALWVIPKTTWIARYLMRRREHPVLGGGSLWRGMSSLVVALQRFIFAHTLLMLLVVQWAFQWDPP